MPYTLAALHGGAKINGFSAVSTDTSIQENLVIQPASQILDYTIISEEAYRYAFYYQNKICSWPPKKRVVIIKDLKSLSVYKP